MDTLTTFNFQDYFEQIIDDLPSHILIVYEGMVEFVQKFGEINNEIANNSLEILSEYFNENYQIETDDIAEVAEVNYSINQDVASDNVIHMELTAQQKEQINFYHLVADHRLIEKLNMINLLHELYGFPLSNGNIDIGINQLCKKLLKASETTYSISSIRNLIYTVISIDNSKIK